MTHTVRKLFLWALAGVILLAAVAVGLLRLFLPIFQFPRPTGPYAIGTLTYHWVDAERAEIFTDAPDDVRELMVQIWYPAAESDGPRTPYIEDGNMLAPIARLLHVPDFTFQHLRWVTTNAVSAAPAAEGAGRSPVLIFLHGRGGYRQHNTAQVEELVSHGYIVVALEQPYAASGVSFPDGRLISLSPRMMEGAFGQGQTTIDDPLIPYLAQDVVFALDQLTLLDQEDPQGILSGRLDLEQVGVFGVSLGGIIGPEACLIDARLRACLAMDAFVPGDVVRAGLSQPTMWISRDAE
ncbi:MAG: carboxylic ester hydrolase, partial [Anaerolineae bacterium]|nr:carboxylic ester hydrolase [Anaerolineae bacterium]